MSASRDGTLQQLPYTRCVADGTALLSPAPRKRSSAVSTTGSISVGACPTPDDQGRARQTLERRPQCRPPRRAVLHPLLDIGRIQLPDPAAISLLPQHAEGKFPLLLLATSGHDGRHTAAVSHSVCQRREHLRPVAHHLGNPLAPYFGVWPDVIDDQAR